MRRILLGLCLALAACGHGKRPHYPKSDHYDGHRFFNPDGEQGSGGRQKQSTLTLLRGLLWPPNRTWPRSIPVTPTRPARRIVGDDMVATWIGHATVLVQARGLNILTDPVWAERSSPTQWFGIRRVREPGVRREDLPRIDLVLLSHDHYDHLDMAMMQWLWARDRPLIVTGLGNDRLLARYGVGAVGRDWGDRVPVRPGIQVIVERAHHWSRYGLNDRNRTLWAGFTVTLPGGDLYFAGDTGPGDMRWAAEAATHGPVRLALLPIGAYHFAGPTTGNHIGPRQAVTAFEQLHAAWGLGVHWGTFELTNEPIDGPPEGLRAALRQDGIAPGRFRTTEVGVPWHVPPMAAAPAATAPPPPPPPPPPPAGRPDQLTPRTMPPSTR